MKIADITPEEYNPYYKIYIEQAGDGELIDMLAQSAEQTLKFFDSIPEEKHLYRYDDMKWTPLEIFQHIIDTERIFAYRAFRFSRLDKTPLQGFDQDDYVNPSLANDKSLTQLKKEYKIERQHSIALFQSLSDKHMSFIGTASGSPMSTRAVNAIMVGHEKHHIKVIQERYL